MSGSVQQVGIFGDYNDSYKAVKVNADGKLEVLADIDMDAEGLATSALQTSGNASLTSIDGKTPALGQAAKTGSVPVTLASDQGTLSVDGSSVTQPVSASALPLPSGAATSALQTAGNASLTSMDGKTPSLGQAAKTGSVPVTLASDQGTLSVDGSSVTQPVSASALPLPSGAATSALQTSGNASLTTIAGDSTSIDTKMTVGSDATLSTAQQVLCYGRDNGGSLDALNVDNSGHLKITVQDEEKSLSSTTLYTAATLVANTPSTAIAMNDKKNIQIVGKTSTSTAKIGIAFQSSGSNYHPNPEYASLYHDGTDYHFAMTVSNVGANSVKVWPQSAASGVDLTYHLF